MIAAVSLQHKCVCGIGYTEAAALNNALKIHSDKVAYWQARGKECPYGALGKLTYMPLKKDADLDLCGAGLWTCLDWEQHSENLQPGAVVQGDLF